MEDLFGEYEVIVFPKTFSTYAQILQQNHVLLIRGKVSIREDEPPKLIAESIEEFVQSGDDGETQAAETSSTSNLSRTMQEKQITEDDRRSDLSQKLSAPPARGQRLGVRFFGKKNDDEYKRMLAFLAYFHGRMPNCRFFCRYEGNPVSAKRVLD